MMGGHGRLRGQEERMIGAKTGCSVCVGGGWEARRQGRQEAGGRMGRRSEDQGTNWGVERLMGAEAGNMGGQG